MINYKKVKRMYSLLNLQMNVQNTVLSLRRHFCPYNLSSLQVAFSSRCICLRAVNISPVATLNTAKLCCLLVTLFPLSAQQSSAVICTSSLRFFYVFILAVFSLWYICALTLWGCPKSGLRSDSVFFSSRPKFAHWGPQQKAWRNSW
jgi:hypothetical protein